MSAAAPKVAADASHAHNTQATPAEIREKFAKMSDAEIVAQVESGAIRFFNIERDIGDSTRAVKVRRDYVQKKLDKPNVLDTLQYEHYNYEEVLGQCCENVIGVVQIPVGVAGPIAIDGTEYFLPMATTEGALVASATRGCKAITEAGGASTQVLRDGMTRAPVLSANSAAECAEVVRWLEADGEAEVKAVFNSTSNYARLKSVTPFVAGRNLFLRFKATTGDGMGMNMVGKGTDKALVHVLTKFPFLKVVALSGNVCTDKKPSAINWVEGRGKSVVAEAVIPRGVVEKTLKTTPEAIVEVNIAKNLVGSAVAGSIGGQNAHASNVVTAMYLALGQDPAQNVESSNCMTTMELTEGGDLYAAVTMPSIEVGTIGGGTILSPQSASLRLLGVKGSDPAEPGKNARQLARMIASGVLAGELSLIAALSSGHLISAHMALNRKPKA
jgi:hydroxymethylglutaryl-CoA reductase (NADPH)